MIKKILLFLGFIYVFSISGYAHETNEAFFKITQKEKTVEIIGEFPWTMRNALIEFNPSLEKTTNKKDFEDAFVEYIKANLILTNMNGSQLEYQEFKELDNDGHSHQDNYLIIFKGKDLIQIKNTIMFNVFDNQVNYNTIVTNENQETFKTKGEQDYFKLSEKKNRMNYLWLLVLIAPIIYFLMKSKKVLPQNS